MATTSSDEDLVNTVSTVDITQVPLSWRDVWWYPWEGIAVKSSWWQCGPAVRPLLSDGLQHCLASPFRAVFDYIKAWPMLSALANWQLILRLSSVDKAFDAARTDWLLRREKQLGPLFLAMQIGIMSSLVASSKEVLTWKSLRVGSLVLYATSMLPWVCGALSHGWYKRHRNKIVFACQFIYALRFLFELRSETAMARAKRIHPVIGIVAFAQVPCRQLVYMTRFYLFLPIFFTHAMVTSALSWVFGHGVALAGAIALALDLGVLLYTYISEVHHQNEFLSSFGGSKAAAAGRRRSESLHSLDNAAAPKHLDTASSSRAANSQTHNTPASVFTQQPASSSAQRSSTASPSAFGGGTEVATSSAVPYHDDSAGDAHNNTFDSVMTATQDVEWDLSLEPLGFKFHALDPVELPHNLISTMQLTLHDELLLFEGCIYPGCTELMFPALLRRSGGSESDADAVVTVAHRVKALPGMTNRPFAVQLGSQAADVQIDGSVVPRTLTQVPRITAVLPALIAANRSTVVTLTCCGIMRGTLRVYVSCGAQVRVLKIHSLPVHDAPTSGILRVECRLPSLPAGVVTLQVCNERVYSNAVALVSVGGAELAQDMARAGINNAYTHSQDLRFIGSSRRLLNVLVLLHKHNALLRALTAQPPPVDSETCRTRMQQMRDASIQIASLLRSGCVAKVLAFAVSSRLVFLLEHIMELALPTYTAAPSVQDAKGVLPRSTPDGCDTSKANQCCQDDILLPLHEWDGAHRSADARAFVRMMQDVEQHACGCGMLHLAINTPSAAALCTLLRWSARYGMAWNWRHRGRDGCMSSCALAAVALACSHSVLLPLAVMSNCSHAARLWSQPCCCEGSEAVPERIAAELLSAADLRSIAQLVQRAKRNQRLYNLAQSWLRGSRNARLEQLYFGAVTGISALRNYVRQAVLAKFWVSVCAMLGMLVLLCSQAWELWQPNAVLRPWQ